MQSDANADVIFTYGPMGNRIGKLVKAKDSKIPIESLITIIIIFHIPKTLKREVII